VLEKISEVEDNLIINAKLGDRSAFGELVSLYYENVIQVVYRLCGDAQIAQDATQEAFIRAWVKLPGYQPRSPFRNWVYRIAVNTALDILRQKPQESLEDSTEVLIMAEKSLGPEAAYIE
jgi:RNA polymerase sigma-70 factor (ECF subfamily)